MKLTFSASGMEQIDMTLKHPDGFSGLKGFEQRLSTASASWANIKIQEQWFDGALVLLSSINSRSACMLKVSCENSYLMMNFVLAGEVNALKAGCYSCLYCDALNIEVEITEELRMLYVCMTRNFLKYRAGNRLMLLDHEFAGTKKFSYMPCNKLVPKRIEQIINEICVAEHPPHIRRIYLEAKILEVLSMHLNQDFSYDPTPKISGVNPADAVKLEQARQLLEQNIKHTFSLLELARRVGLNDFKLKKGFKVAYGYTVFGYLSELRMEKAKVLLRTGLSVNEVADAVGYKNPQHFTSVFKKRFQVLPSKILNYED